MLTSLCPCYKNYCLCPSSEWEFMGRSSTCSSAMLVCSHFMTAHQLTVMSDMTVLGHRGWLVLALIPSVPTPNGHVVLQWWLHGRCLLAGLAFCLKGRALGSDMKYIQQNINTYWKSFRYRTMTAVIHSLVYCYNLSATMNCGTFVCFLLDNVAKKQKCNVIVCVTWHRWSCLC